MRRKKHKDPPEAMCKEVHDSGRGDEVCRDRSAWLSVLSDYPARDGNRVGREVSK